MRHNGCIGLTKEHIRRIVLSKLRIVYRHWQSKENPFSSGKKSGSRRSDARAFETALVASLLGSLSEAIEQNNRAHDGRRWRWARNYTVKVTRGRDADWHSLTLREMPT